MRCASMRRGRAVRRSAAASIWLSAAIGSLATAANAHAQTDPRVGLGAGWMDAKSAVRNLELVAHRPKPEGFFNATKPGERSLNNTDFAFKGTYAFQGNYHGFLVWDISNPANPTLRTSFACPGGQGDLSVYENLLFMSVEETRGRGDCGGQGVADTVSSERSRGVRIFDISDIDRPRKIVDVQTCRGSHTHTLVTDPRDAANVYIYVSGTAGVRPGAELAGCSGGREEDPNSSYFRIEVIRVPVAAPQDAKVVNSPRIFADSVTGSIAGLWKGGNHGEGTQITRPTIQCHDITAYSELGLAAGACAGNGILLDIRDPANPRRVDEVIDQNFNYFHSATFSNDGSKVLFTDEWGGGNAPKCRATDRPEWGADAIFTLSGGKMRHAGYYKLPAAQTETENCVAHNGSLIPVPGRDILVQAWYQGGLSVFDFTDPRKPVEIAYFDRGPMSATELMTGGYWSTYWYNGYIYASEMGRGLDVFRLTPSEHLSQTEIDAAKLVRVDLFNPQDQRKVVWPASALVVRARLEGLARSDGLRRSWASGVSSTLNRAERLTGQPRRAALTRLAEELERDARDAAEAKRVRDLAAAVRELAASTR